jgi:hypothetical protein
MARGWESKAVEAQQAEAAEATRPARVHLSREQMVRLQKQEGLILARKHILEQLRTTENSRHRQILENALADLDRKIADLES